MTPYFLDTKITPKCIDKIRAELESPTWYISPFGVERSDLSKLLRSHIQSLLPFKISDAGFLRRRPGTIYHPHVDPRRTFALNMLLTDDQPVTEGTYVVTTGIYNENNEFKFSYAGNRKVEYTKDCFTVLNVKKIHYVVNNSSADRIILSIGCNELAYEDVMKTIMKDLTCL